ncbi:cyclophilin-like fold protein [Frigidibacter sp. MR17.14]|uniref:cyclophilin-like fold protein n=1 Tax=Frigidibacter sp. MR17.14 TaxID=3126509 RepID=UPI003012D9DE
MTTAHLGAASFAVCLALPGSVGSAETRTIETMNIRVTFGTTVLHATLDDTAAARDFATLLPLELQLSDYHGVEKVANLPRALALGDTPRRSPAMPGDIMHYAPWGNLAIFYGTAVATPGLVRLGRFTDLIDPLVAASDARIRIEAE